MENLQDDVMEEPESGVTLSELKVADEFDSLLRRLNILTIDVQRVVHC